MLCQTQTIYLSNPKTKQSFQNKTVAFGQGQERIFFDFNEQFQSPKKYCDYMNQQFESLNEFDHALVIHLNNTQQVYTKDLFFSSFIQSRQNLFSFKVNAFEDPKFVQVYTSGDDFLQEKTISTPCYLRTQHNYTRLSTVFINADTNNEQPTPLGILFAKCKNVMFKCCDDNLFSQINKIYFVVHHAEENMLQTKIHFNLVKSVQSKVKSELLQYRCIRNKNQAAIDHYFSKQMGNFQKWRSKNQKLQQLSDDLEIVIMAKSQLYLLQFMRNKPEQGNHLTRYLMSQIQQRQIKLKMSQQEPASIGLIQGSRSIRRVVVEQQEDHTPQDEQLLQNILQKYKNFQRFTNILMREMKKILFSKLEPPFAVFLNTYNLLQTNVLNNLGVGFFHSAIEILGVEIAFGGHDYDETGVYCIKPKTLNGATFHKQVYLEHTFLSKQQIVELFLDSAINWRGNQYDILHKNCNNWTDEMAQKLTGVGIPNWVNRAAVIGKAFKKREVKVTGKLEDIVKYQGKTGRDDM